jgi:hypothetical protein
VEKVNGSVRPCLRFFGDERRAGAQMHKLNIRSDLSLFAANFSPID